MKQHRLGALRLHPGACSLAEPLLPRCNEPSGQYDARAQVRPCAAGIPYVERLRSQGDEGAEQPPWTSVAKVAPSAALTLFNPALTLAALIVTFGARFIAR